MRERSRRLRSIKSDRPRGGTGFFDCVSVAPLLALRSERQVVVNPLNRQAAEWQLLRSLQTAHSLHVILFPLLRDLTFDICGAIERMFRPIVFAHL